ncbi:MAG: hypothetical protein C4551_10555 [Bacillota bacterium]|jgi:hypothetical protein|nr:MAG: hypothetical protein C4551_10555 [Bacillota bacterium]
MGLKDCEGQPRVARSLLSALQRGRLAHAYLLAGPVGSGKRRVATELARAALCERPSAESDACGGCEACRAVGDGRHPDVEFFRPPDDKAAYPVKQVREQIKRHAYLRPALGKRRMLVIERAEALVKGSGGQNESADTLLKLLEEPPRDTVIVLLAAHPERLPETVRSRCQYIRFEPPSTLALAEALMESDRLDPDQAAYASRLSGGDLALAREFVRGRKKDSPNLGLVREALLDIVRFVGTMTVPGILAVAAKLDGAARGWPALVGALGILALLYRDSAVKAAARHQGGSSSTVSVETALAFRTGPEASATSDAARDYGPDTLLEMASRVLRAQEDCGRYPARLLLLEVLLLDLAGLPRHPREVAQ